MTPLEARAPTSSRIPAVATRLAAPVALAPDQCRRLLCDLATITDPRQRRGRRHTLGAVRRRQIPLVAIGEWAADAPQPVMAALGVRRVLARVEPDALDRAIGAWLAAQQPPSPAT